MNLKRIACLSLALVTFTLVSFTIDKDPLHKRKFKAQAQAVDPVTKAAKGKPFEDEIEFKNGKVYSLACWDKMEFQDVRYEITKDSTYTDEGEEKHYYEVLAQTTNDKKETIIMNLTVNGYDVEATYKLTKKDQVKKMFTSMGSEKVKGHKDKEKEKEK